MDKKRLFLGLFGNFVHVEDETLQLQVDLKLFEDENVKNVRKKSSVRLQKESEVSYNSVFVSTDA